SAPVSGGAGGDLGPRHSLSRVLRRSQGRGSALRAAADRRAEAARAPIRGGGAVHERAYSLDFYLGRTLPRATGRRSLQAAVAEHPGGIWIVPRANVPEGTRNLRLAVTPIAESPTAAALRLSPAAVFAVAPDGPARRAPARGVT